MDYKQGISNYQNIQFQTADPAKLIMLMYNKIDEELNKAKELIKIGKIEQKGNSIVKSQDIIMELLNSLDLDIGPIAKNLQALYLFLFKELNLINFKNDLEKLDKVIEIINSLKSAWEEIIQNRSANNQTKEYKKEKTENFALVG